MKGLSLIGILLLLFIVFYAAKSVVILFAGILILVIIFKFGRKEKFSTDPIDTGMERPVWGPLFPVESKEMKDNTYYTMKSLPWALPILAGDEHV